MWVKTAAEAVMFLNTNKVEEISLDHDLGDDEPNGYVVATFIEERAHDWRIRPLKWNVHSDNPVGRSRIIAALENANRYWDGYEERE
jgi:hypothetical protein